MNRRRLKYSGKEIVPESLDLHVFIADQSEIDKHIQTHKQLDNTSGMSVFLYEKQHPERYRQSYVAEIKQIKQILFCQPQGHGDRLENDKYDKRTYIFIAALFHNYLVKLSDSRTEESSSSILSLFLLTTVLAAFMDAAICSARPVSSPSFLSNV